MKLSKKQSRQRIHSRIRKSVSGTADKPRLCVFRSNSQIYCQLIDDRAGHTVAAASSVENGISKDGNRTIQAKKVGELIANKAKGLNISDVVFDRGGYLYHGRIKSLAEGAREGGLKF
ncbi:50S ribosomal protein L18 [Portibacter lacus]|uniref:Large ribosomal subunit protein uL18 n=1 Tax=Portibacter lacus TaxID=1099794 RepID=A0AA37WG18_9BACT|nr:50S ribosomal protein L18 [Portibacter lacus]GLR19333.1 50S ribosomal protein L18 [Portibacter lacus]